VRVVITGGAGFLGSHLCDLFIEKGHSVIAIDNLLTGNLHNIEHLRRYKEFKFIKHDVTRYINVPGRVDAVLHFASPASPQYYLKYPIPTLKVGALGTHNALGLAKAKKARFLLASTSEVYGDPLIHPQPESYWGNVNPVGFRSVYDEAKRFAEAMSIAYQRYHGVKVRIVRIFNTYGPRMCLNDGRAIPNFIYQALSKKPITIYGNGKQTRSFCYVDDLMDGLYRLLMSDLKMPVNIGNPEEITLRDIAEKIMVLTKTKSKMVYKPLPEDDPKIRRPDIKQAKTKLRWQPKVKLNDGLKMTIDYFQKSITMGRP
jgi:dTDP-glucose 4,6-dehydratase